MLVFTSYIAAVHPKRMNPHTVN